MSPNYWIVPAVMFDFSGIAIFTVGAWAFVSFYAGIGKSAPEDAWHITLGAVSLMTWGAMLCTIAAWCAS